MLGVQPDTDRPIPHCPRCGKSKVVPLYAVRIRQGAHCYACKDCGHVFGACAEAQTSHVQSGRAESN
jgi:predicted RNA-binding Zn-ribbon protein involved in translation (DUF1610 family)